MEERVRTKREESAPMTGAQDVVKTETTNGAGLRAAKPIGKDAIMSVAPLIEISDADYRSFQLPCLALDDQDDGHPAR
jgi:hypothetical protein